MNSPLASKVQVQATAKAVPTQRFTMKFEPQAAVAYFGAGVTVTGAVHAQDTVVIEGALRGEINCARLVLGAHAAVSGKVCASDMEIFGCADAEIDAKLRLFARSTSRLSGTWTCGALIAERGATLNGTARKFGQERRRKSEDIERKASA